jgi:hypothetical protein
VAGDRSHAAEGHGGFGEKQSTTSQCRGGVGGRYCGVAACGYGPKVTVEQMVVHLQDGACGHTTERRSSGRGLSVPAMTM